MNYGCIVENQDTNEVILNYFSYSVTSLPPCPAEYPVYLHLSIQVLHYVEKPSTFVSDIINCGIYLFTPDIFQHIGAVFQKNQQDLLL